VTSEQWHDELVLITELSKVNRQIGQYVLRALDADAKRAEPTPPDSEHALGEHLAALGQRLQERATQRTADAGRVVIDGISTDEPEQHGDTAWTQPWDDTIDRRTLPSAGTS
jgi:hypothetical protein